MAVCLALATGLSFLPTPAFEFVPRASASTAPLAGLTESSPGRVSGGENRTDSFNLIGISFTRRPSQPVRVRVRDAASGWTEWSELEVEADDGPDGNSTEGSSPRAVSEPYVHVGAIGYQFDLAASDAADSNATVSLVREELKRVVVDATPLASTAEKPLFPVQSRSEWGAAPFRDGKPTPNSSVKLAVVHHTAGQNNYSQGSVPGIINGIQAYHQNANGWSDIGYNFLVDRFGGIWEGRAGSIDLASVGAHAQGFNTGSVGVSVLGDYTKTSPSPQAIEAVSKVAAWRLWLNEADPTGSVSLVSGGSPKFPAGTRVTLPRIVGHRDVGLTSCPGSIYGFLPQIRTRAKQLYQQWGSEKNPIGRLDPLIVENGRLTIEGWAQVPTTDEPVVIHISVNDRWRITTANLSRPDVPKARPELRENVGYRIYVDDIPKDTPVKVCAYGISQGTGANPLLGCRSDVVK